MVMSYSEIEQLRSKKQFLRVELSEHTVEGEKVEGVDPKIGLGYVTKTAVVFGLGVAAPAFDNLGISPATVFGVQTFLVGLMVGQLSKRARDNSKLNALEQSYIKEHGNVEDVQRLHDNLDNNKNFKPLKRFFLGASTVLIGSMVAIEAANNGSATLASNAVAVAGSFTLVSAAVTHFYDKLAMADRGQLAHAIAKRRDETQSAAPATPVAKATL